MRWLPFALLVACDPMPPTGAPLQPVPAAAKRAPGPSAAAPASQPTTSDGFDFVEDEGTEPEPSEEDIDDPAALLALAQGLPIPDPIAPAPVVVPLSVAPMPSQVQSTSAPVAMRVWTPGVDVAADWGVRVVSTVVDSQPPRAILGLPNGTEVVVQPGTMLAESRLVVMAVGRDVVQVSRVVPEGYQARIETRTLRAFYPVQPLTP